MIFEKRATDFTARHTALPHAVYLPKGYEEDPYKRWPLVIFLHGAGERGSDLQAVYRHGPLREVREGREFPFIVIAPQIEAPKYWACYAETLNAMLDGWLKEYRVDPTRVYLTGLSMGGTGTWMLSMAAPEKFAAVVPVCGSGIYWYGEVLVNTPVKMYHGDCDDIVPIQESISMLNSINKRGGHAELTICYGMGHNAWDVAYAGDELVEWMMAQRLK